jgi:hypothetical protein
VEPSWTFLHQYTDLHDTGPPTNYEVVSILASLVVLVPHVPILVVLVLDLVPHVPILVVLDLVPRVPIVLQFLFSWRMDHHHRPLVCSCVSWAVVRPFVSLPPPTNPSK